MYDFAPMLPGMMPSSPCACADGALARDEQALAEVLLLRDVVVMAVDRLAIQRETAAARAAAPPNQTHHLAPVEPGVVLSPLHRLDVVVEQLRALAEVSEILVRQVELWRCMSLRAAAMK